MAKFYASNEFDSFKIKYTFLSIFDQIIKYNFMHILLII